MFNLVCFRKILSVIILNPALFIRDSTISIRQRRVVGKCRITVFKININVLCCFVCGAFGYCNSPLYFTL